MLQATAINWASNMVQSSAPAVRSSTHRVYSRRPNTIVETVARVAERDMTSPDRGSAASVVDMILLTVAMIDSIQGKFEVGRDFCKAPWRSIVGEGISLGHLTKALQGWLRPSFPRSTERENIWSCKVLRIDGRTMLIWDRSITTLRDLGMALAAFLPKRTRRAFAYLGSNKLYATQTSQYHHPQVCYMFMSRPRSLVLPCQFPII